MCIIEGRGKICQRKGGRSVRHMCVLCLGYARLEAIPTPPQEKKNSGVAKNIFCQLFPRSILWTAMYFSLVPLLPSVEECYQSHSPLVTVGKCLPNLGASLDVAVGAGHGAKVFRIRSRARLGTFGRRPSSPVWSACLPMNLTIGCSPSLLEKVHKYSVTHFFSLFKALLLCCESAKNDT